MPKSKTTPSNGKCREISSNASEFAEFSMYECKAASQFQRFRPFLSIRVAVDAQDVLGTGVQQGYSVAAAAKSSIEPSAAQRCNYAQELFQQNRAMLRAGAIVQFASHSLGKSSLID